MSAMITDPAVKTLFYPFQTGDIELKNNSTQWLFLNGCVPPADCPFLPEQLTIIQGFKPDFLKLQNTPWGSSSLIKSLSDSHEKSVQLPYNVRNIPVISPYNSRKSPVKDISDSDAGDVQVIFDGGLILISRHRGESMGMLNQALKHTKKDALIVVAGAKNDGIAAIAKEVATIYPLLGSLSKNHGKVFWFENKKTNLFEQDIHTLVEGKFQTRAGMFSSKHVDEGSQFLMRHVPIDLKGHVADFCAGWGYLSVTAALACLDIKSIDLYEADAASLEAAGNNMVRLAPDMKAEYYWFDLTSEKTTNHYHTILMNPPFHHGRVVDLEMARAIIKNAHHSLIRGGTLYLVANKTLPYEEILSKTFFKFREITRNDGYKILAALK
jgi:16S rRNA (guanine1207-N2)-methyltransferase